MCKVMILTGVQDSKLALEFMKAVAPSMSLFNTDGIGYSAINSKNQLFSEKWHNNRQFLDTESVIDQETLTALEPFRKKLSGLALNYQPYGEVTRDDIRTVTMHTRFATCGKEFANTHPFIDHGMSLIHNGGISNCAELGLNKISTCDSENALQLYNNMGLNLTKEKGAFQSFTDQLKGYWAFAFLAKDQDGNYMLDIVRERASLYWTYLPELGEDCIVFATTSETIDTGCKALGLEVRKKIWTLTESNYHRFNAVTGEIVMDIHKLKESTLNKYVYNYNSTKHYKSNKRNADVDVVDNIQYINGKKYVNGELETLVEDEILTVDEIAQANFLTSTDGKEEYEGFRANKEEISKAKKFKESLQGVSDDLDIENFFDKDAILTERLTDYDKLMNTMYRDVYDDLPFNVRMFIEKKEDEDYIIFSDVIEMIDQYVETEAVSQIFGVYKKNKRA